MVGTYFGNDSFDLLEQLNLTLSESTSTYFLMLTALQVIASSFQGTPAPFIISPPREETILVPAPDLLDRQGRGFRWS